MNFSGKKFFVTGVSSGIGESTAILLIQAGAQVVGADKADLRNPQMGLGTFQRLDLSDSSAIDRCVAEAGTGYDGLINVAGVSSMASTELQFRVNFLGTRHLTEKMLPALKADASVINVASGTGLRWQDRLSVFSGLVGTKTFEEGLRWLQQNPQDGPLSYGLSKEAQIIWTLRTAVQWVGTGRRINSISPGLVSTPMMDEFRQAHGAALIDKDAGRSGRAGTAEDIARAILLVLSDDARWINGANIAVDGAFSASVMLSNESWGAV